MEYFHLMRALINKVSHVTNLKAFYLLNATSYIIVEVNISPNLINSKKVTGFAKRYLYHT